LSNFLHAELVYIHTTQAQEWLELSS